MKNIKTKLCAFLLLGFVLNQMYAQQGSTASGGDGSGSGGTIAYSVGQIGYTTNTGTGGSTLQGVQHPYEILVTLGLAETGINLHIIAYPNPTTNYLMLKIDDPLVNSKQSLFYQLFDVSGKLLGSKTIISNSTMINMEKFATGNYFLKVTQNNKAIKTFKIIKN